MENLAPHVIRRVAKELAELVSQPPEGIKVIPNEEDVSDIQAVVEGPGKGKGKSVDPSFPCLCCCCLGRWGFPGDFLLLS